MADISLDAAKRDRKPSTFLFLAAASALLGAVTMGTVLGWPSNAVPDMTYDKNSTEPYNATKHGLMLVDKVDDQIKAWIGASITLAALVGALASGPIGSKLGRKIALIIFGVPGILGYALMAAANSFALIILGRSLTGLSIGLISGIAPTYVVEISTPNVRGLLGTCFQLCVTIGILYSILFGAFIRWYWLSFACLVPVLAMSIIMLFMPETPIWLMTHSGGDYSKGSKVEQSLKKLRDESNDNDGELQTIAQEADDASKTKSFTFKESKNPLFYKPMILSLLLMIFQQFSGINAVVFNMTNIFEKAGVDKVMPSKYSSIIVGIVQVIATGVSAFLSDRLGRKKLLIGSSVGHIASLGILGVYFAIKTESAQWLPVILVTVFIISFSMGWGPIPWMMVAEMTPMQYRSMVASVATAVNWLAAFLITFNFESIQNATKDDLPGFPFFFFTAFCIASIPFVLFFLPETKGKPIDEIIKRFAPNDKTTGEGTPNASNAMLKGDNKTNDNMEMKAVA